jgi:CheY-like chemotaxis protein
VNPAGAAHQILVVEEDRDLRGAVGQVLEEEGYAVFSASNGLEALQLLEQGRPCMILLDLMMPVMNGWQLLEKRKAENKYGEIPIVVMSAYLGMPGFAVPHLPVGATLKKPLDLSRLLQTIVSLCARHAKEERKRLE